MYRVCAVIFVIFCVTSIVTGFFQTDCPYGCAQRRCTLTGGCTRCIPNYCVSYMRLGNTLIPFCTQFCGKGKQCVKAAGLWVCTAKPKTTTPRNRRWRIK